MATLLQINHLTKSYGPRLIIDDATLTIAEKQKIGVIGRNGAGKSTVFNIIVGHEQFDSGEVIIHDNTRLGYLTQHDTFSSTETVLSFLLRDNPDCEEWQCAKMADQFQIPREYFTKLIQTLSGGFQMRVKLTSLFLKEPNLLLLDEPTNYLDLSTLILLEQVLKKYRGSFLIISHDREFLKNTCDMTLEIDQGKMFLYPRPIEEYLAYKDEQIEMAKRFNKKIEREQRHLQAFVDRFRYKASKATQAQSKLKQINKLKTIDIVHPLHSAIIRIPQIDSKTGTALRIDDLVIGYGEKQIATEINIDIDRGEHIAIVGDNGQGKTTFLKTIAGELPALAGRFRWGPHIQIGYYAQHVPSMLHASDQVIEYLNAMAAPEIKLQEILSIAGNFLFHGDDVHKTVSMLSGGEKARLCLAGLLLQKNHVLLLDEPTNHLDFETVEALAYALESTNSTVLFVSHNRTFVNVLATGIIEVQNGQVKRFHRNYEEYVYYLEQHLATVDLVQTTTIQSAPETVQMEKTERKKIQQELKQEKKKLQAIEMELMELEREKQQLLHWFEHHTNEYSREKNEQLQGLTDALEKKEAEWMLIQGWIDLAQRSITKR